MSLPYKRTLISRAKELRRNATDQEDKLWYRYLRSYPIRFQRQKTIDTFIADFYCSKARLIVEIDGKQHFSVAGQEYDLMRSAVFERYGIAVLRFANIEVENQFMSVCDQIDQTVKERIACL